VPGISPAIDYTARTFEVLRERALDLLKRRLTSFRYNDTIASGVVPAIIDVLAWFQEQNAHYYDRRQINSLLTLADTREAMVPLALAQGYRVRPATSASVAVEATPTPPQPVPITLRAGTRVTVGDLTFEVGADAVIPAGRPFWPDSSTTEVIVLVEGATRVETFVSDGTKFQAFELGQVGTIDGSVRVVVIGEEWAEVESLAFIEGDRRGRDNFTSDGADSQSYALTLLHAVVDPDDEDAVIVLVTPSGGAAQDAQRWRQVSALTGAPREFTLTQNPAGETTLTFGLAADGSSPPINASIDVLYLIAGAQKRYQLTFDADDRGTIRFGDGVFGVIPPAGATLTVSYRTGGGVRGNVRAGAIDSSVQGMLPNGATTNVRLQNLEPGSGGEPPETVDHVRFFAPRFAKSNERAVTREDFTTLAATYIDALYGAPAHASAYLKQRVPELNTVQVALWSRDENGQLTGDAGTPLKLGVKNLLDSKRTITTVVEMVDGRVILLDIEADIVLEVGAVRQDVFAAVTTAINSYFASGNVLPGVDLSISKLYSAIQNVEGVERAEITRVTGSIRQTLAVGTGDGTTVLFTGQYTLEEGTSLVEQSVVVTDGTQQVVDNGDGSFSGDVDPGVSPGAAGNAVDYVAGHFSVQFASPPALGEPVTSEAKLGVFFEKVEDIGASDGSVATVDGATDYYPVVKRAPRGVWSGDPRIVIDAFRVGITKQFRGRLLRGINVSTLTIQDSTGIPQVITDNGAGVLIGAVDPLGNNVVNYGTGEIDATFLAAPVLPVFASWQTKVMDFFVPSDLLPLAPGRVYVWGGYGADGVQTPAELIAYDDGEGNIAGNVLAGGTIDYQSGRVLAEWNTAPPPGPAGGNAYTATLGQVPNGVRRTFDFSFPADISRFAGSNADRGEGRTRLQFHRLSVAGVTLQDGFDNWQGRIHGPSVDRVGQSDVVAGVSLFGLPTNTLDYALGRGRVTFLVPLPIGAPVTFTVRITNVATLLYAGFVYRVKTPTIAGLDKGLFADNNGRFWGPPAAGPSNPFPTDQLDHLRGRYHAGLAGSPIAAGRLQELTYDTRTGVPPALDVPIAGDEVAAPGRIALTEKAPETSALA
jgi:uncharacterized phage protein gp47/JayE